jgi:hypothetical protein
MSNTILIIINIINSSALRMYQLSAVYMVVWVREVVTVILRFCWGGRKIIEESLIKITTKLLLFNFNIEVLSNIPRFSLTEKSCFIQTYSILLLILLVCC